MSDDERLIPDPRIPSKGAWLAALFGACFAFAGVLVIGFDVYLVNMGLPTISRRTLVLSQRWPWTAGAIAFTAMLPAMILGGHLWWDESRYAFPPAVAAALVGVLGAALVGFPLGWWLFGQK